MKNRELVLSDISTYLPYRLTVCYEKDIKEIRNVDIIGWMELAWVGFNPNIPSCNNMQCRLECLKPLLLPISDLDKPMCRPDINGGKEFIPMHLFIDNKEWLGSKVIQEGEVKPILNKITESIELSLWRNDGWNSQYTIHLVPSVIQLLSRLHFDYSDLIGQGLAINKKNEK